MLQSYPRNKILTTTPLLFCVLALLGLTSGTHAQQKADDFVAPKLISQLQPEYPKEAKDAGLEGTVSVHLKIDANGNVTSVDSPSGLGRICGTLNFQPLQALYNSVMDAAKQAKFSPATKAGQPVEAEVWLNSKFKLPEPKAPNTTQPGATPKTISGGVINGRAKSLPPPEYPGAARAVRASGAVPVRITFDEKGRVVRAAAIGGHPLLRYSAEEAACKAKFSPVQLDGKAISVTGVVTYNFVP